VLTRGYGGTITGPELLDVDRHSALQSGDEARLLARRAPVVIARDRAAGGRFIADRNLGSVIVMDDGLQNPGLKKDLTFAVIDAHLGFGNGLVIPAGPLRASLGAQAAVTDAFVLNHGSSSVDDGHRAGPLAAALAALPLRPTLNGRLVAFDAPDPAVVGPVLAYAGIGVPERFFDALERHGFVIGARRAFGDHHVFSEAEAQALSAEAHSRGLRLMTTEKDAARLDGAVDGPRKALRTQSLVFPVRFAFDAADGALLTDLLRSVARVDTRSDKT
jgi:tetraacyldisaccharide 4'-kinase